MATAALEDLCTAPLKTVIYENTYITEPEEVCSPRIPRTKAAKAAG